MAAIPHVDSLMIFFTHAAIAMTFGDSPTSKNSPQTLKYAFEFFGIRFVVLLSALSFKLPLILQNSF